MKRIAEQVRNLVTEMQIIADHLEEYNPGLCKDKVPLPAIQYDLACLGRDLTWLYAEIGRKIKDNDDL